MVYLDNAATSWPKPAAVRNAVQRALTVYGANPGRSGHSMGLAASEAVYRCREELADFFHLPDPSGVVFVQNCTMALNIVLKGLLREGGRAVVSDLEHNAVMRPLHALSPDSPVYDTAAVVPGNTQATVAAFERCIVPETRVIVCTHASNVFGIRLPIREIGAMAHRYGLPFVVDAAQSAGLLPIDMQKDNVDFLCIPGHKGLYGPAGIGALLCNSSLSLPTFVEGGTGSQSLELLQPEELPDRLESGTLNTVGICGLQAGVGFVRERGMEELAGRETRLMASLYDRLANLRGVRLYTPRPDLRLGAPVLSFNLAGRRSEEVAQALDGRKIACRAGLHCAPAAHRRFGTLESGTVRLAPSAFTTAAEIDRVCRAIWCEVHAGRRCGQQG
ncbi:MAG TPA: aminotransferase class V-fold PLP-dependent enzyme [Firmicutes bacterium]|nr:aminotransferase class V-fold PLP-dependent enzyme [Bacillota bacterium]